MGAHEASSAAGLDVDEEVRAALRLGNPGVSIASSVRSRPIECIGAKQLIMKL